MTAGQAAAYLQVHAATVYRMARAGELPVRKVRGRWRFSRRQLLAWLEAQDRVGPTAPEDGPGGATGEGVE